MKQQKKLVRLTIARIPEELKHKFKALCASNGSNMRIELIKLIEMYLKLN